MVAPILLLPIFVTEILCNPQTDANDAYSIVSAAVVFRHGDRTPVKPYPSDPYRDPSYWPVGFGQLTNIGKIQHFHLGQWLRDRYNDFLPLEYSEKDIHVLSTDVDRTLMSAEANLAGLYPPKGRQIWNQNVDWQPIPIHTIPENEDGILAMKMPCDKYNYLLNELLESRMFVDIDKNNQALYSYLTHYTGKQIVDLENMEYIYNTLAIETIYNLTLPNWTRAVFPDKMKPWADFSFAIPCFTKDLARLKIGPLLNDIVDHFTKATWHKSLKMFMYSAHDTTVANILNGLNAFEYHSPPYAAAVLFELRTLNGSYFVNILYKNGTVPHKIVMKGCSFYCPLDKFVELLASVRLGPTQWKAECEMKFLGVVPFSTVQNTMFISCTVFLVLLLSGILASFFYKKFRSANGDYMQLPSEDA